MKIYDLDKINPLLKDCRKFLIMLIMSYKLQGVKIPQELKELKVNIENQINKIEGDKNVKGKRTYKVKS